jgi:hypothetical protein
LFATDYNKPLNRKGADAMFTVLNGAVTHVLHVNDRGTTISDEQQQVKQSILNLLIGHTVEIIEETETVESVDSVIQQQAKNRNVDAIVVMPYHNSFFERIFHASIWHRHQQFPFLQYTIRNFKPRSYGCSSTFVLRFRSGCLCRCYV